MPRLNRIHRLTLIALALASLATPAARAEPVAADAAPDVPEAALADEAAAADLPDDAPAADADLDAASDADLDALLDVGTPAAGSEAATGIKWGGYAELGMAYTYRDPERWSHLRARGELTGSGQVAPRVRWKLNARAELDGAFDLEDEHYPAAVRRDQRRDLMLREAYVDVGHGDWEFRFGRQHVVWGEMVGFFFADVVSARDMRDFLQTELERMRIGQWAVRAERFGADTHFELLWVPKPSFDQIGKPGSDFYTYPWMPADTVVSEDRPGGDIDDGNWGARISHLVDGWDLSAFYYHSYDVAPTLHAYAPGRAELRHERIDQVGGTFSKDLGSFVLKGEAVPHEWSQREYLCAGGKSARGRPGRHRHGGLRVRRRSAERRLALQRAVLRSPPGRPSASHDDGSPRAGREPADRARHRNGSRGRGARGDQPESIRLLAAPEA